MKEHLRSRATYNSQNVAVYFSKIYVQLDPTLWNEFTRNVSYLDTLVRLLD